MKTILVLVSLFTITLLTITPAPLSLARQPQQPERDSSTQPPQQQDGDSSPQQQQQPALPTLNQLKAKGFTVTTLDGERVSLNSLLGEGKPVLLDFWATWCGPCRMEIPHLKALNKEYGKDGLIVIGLNLEDPVQDKLAVKKFVRDFGMDY